MQVGVAAVLDCPGHTVLGSVCGRTRLVRGCVVLWGQSREGRGRLSWDCLYGCGNPRTLVCQQGQAVGAGSEAYDHNTTHSSCSKDRPTLAVSAVHASMPSAAPALQHTKHTLLSLQHTFSLSHTHTQLTAADTRASATTAT